MQSEKNEKQTFSFGIVQGARSVTQLYEEKLLDIKTHQ